MPFAETATAADAAWATAGLVAAVVAIGASAGAAVKRRTRAAWAQAGATAASLVLAPAFVWLAASRRADQLGGGASMTWWFSYPALRAYAVLAVGLAIGGVAALLERER